MIIGVIHNLKRIDRSNSGTHVNGDESKSEKR